MSAEEKVELLRGKLEEIRDCTYAEFQDLPKRAHEFNRAKHICPVCLRAATADHLKKSFARIQALAAEGLRLTDDRVED